MRSAAAFAKAGKTIDMGKPCIRFHDVDELPLAGIGELIESVSVEKWIADLRSVTAQTNETR